MFIMDWLRSFKGKSLDLTDDISGSIPLEIFYKEYALQACISIAANALVMSEFLTYEKGLEVKKNNYYSFNIEPNKNQNATEFWHECISKLFYKNEVLIIQKDGEYFIADSFNVDKYVFYEDIYKDVVVREYALKETFKESDVLYFKLNNTNIKKIIDGLYLNYGKLLSKSIHNYNSSSGKKGILKIKTMFAQKADSQDKINDLMETKFKKYFEKDNAVLPLQEGLDFEESKNTGISKDTRDIKNLVNDIIDFVCASLHVPAGLVKGDVVDVEAQTDNFITFCINPLAKLITSEVNRKIYKKDDFIGGSYLRVDTQKIKSADLQKLSSSADLLFRIGVNSINDNLKMLGREPINEDWAMDHYVTKNYQSVFDLKGGENKNADGTKNSNITNKE